MASKAARIEFNDKLITAVQKRPIVWDSERLDYKDQRRKALAWAEVAAEIGCDPEASNLQARWKSLRDTFTKKYRVWKVGAPSGSGAADAKNVNDVKWPYFTLLKFLKDQVDIGSTTSNIPELEDTQDTAETLLTSIYSDVTEVLDGDSSLDEAASGSYAEDSCPEPAALQTSTARRIGTSVSTPSRTKKKKTRWEQDLDKVDQLITDDKDQASLYGQILAAKLRACPKRVKKNMEFELLDFFKKYTFDETE